jgi:hypothetical protein
MATWQMHQGSPPSKMPRGHMYKHDATESLRTPEMTVLVAFEDPRRVYRDVFVQAIRDLRPALTVRSAPLDGLERALERFDPDVVVCSQPNRHHLTGHGAWVHIPTDDGMGDDERLAEICLDGERWRTDGPPLSELLAVIDETRERMREGSLTRSC